MNLDTLFRQTAKSMKQQPAIMNQDGSCGLTYEGLDQAIDEVCRALKASGLQPKSCIGLNYDSGLDYIVLTYAIWRANAFVVPISTDTSHAEKCRILSEIAIYGMIGAPGTIHKLPLNMASGVQVINGKYEFALLNPSRVHPEGFADINTAFLRFSSGTTSTAKGVVLSHQTIFERIEAANEVLKIVPGDKVVWLLSMAYHFAVSIVAYLTYGAAIILCRNQSGATVVTATRLMQASIIYGAPLHFEWMLQDCRDSHHLTSVRFAIATTAAARPNLSTRFRQKFGIPVNRALGVIEVGLPCIDFDPIDSKEGAIGKLLPAYSLELRPVGNDSEHTEIVLHGPGLFDAYYHPFARREDLSPGGWFSTGDVGELDADGRLYILGRIKEVINIGGMKVFPSDIEAALNNHPNVAESCAYAHQHPVLGEVPYASVVLAGKNDIVSTQSLMQHCIKCLAKYAVPSQIIIVSSLPRTASGKLIRRESAHVAPLAGKS